MVQHIGLQREEEDGTVIAAFDRAGVPIEVLDLASPDSACARFIDPYGDTVFNHLQLPVLIEEFPRHGRRLPGHGFLREDGGCDSVPA